MRNVVEGSVRRSGERLRVTAQLISVADGYHLWSETYDRDVADVFAIQEEVATKVAEALSVRIAGRSLAQRPPPDPRAYELYLTGRQLWNLRTADSMRRSIGYFEQALALDPSYAPALSGIADASTHHPLSPVIVADAGKFASTAGDCERAIELLRRAVDLTPQSTAWRLELADAYSRAGRESEALEAVLAAVPPTAQDAIRGAAEAGGTKAVRELLLRMEQERTGQPCGSRALAAAGIYATLGDTDGVFRCLEEGARIGNWVNLKLDSVFAPYRSDPRYWSTSIRST